MSSQNLDRENKNAVFGDGGTGEGFDMGNQVPRVSQQEYARKELGLELPVDAVPLPSKGSVYPKGHPLHLSPAVEYRSMTARDEDILMSQAFIKKGTVVTELIKSCLMDKAIDVNSLLVGDRNALMIAIRSSGYGSDYNPSYSCPKCEFKNDLHIDLNQLEIKPLELEPVTPGENLFKFTLPVSKKTVAFRFLTGKEEEEIVAQAESRRKKGITVSNVITTKLLLSIVQIEGVSDRSMIAKFVQNMPARDSLELRKFMDENEPGVNTTVDFRCTNCDHEDEVAMPMSATFLWPNAK